MFSRKRTEYHRPAQLPAPALVRRPESYRTGRLLGGAREQTGPQRMHDHEEESDLSEAGGETERDPHSAGKQTQADVKITFCNRAYADGWYKMVRRQTPDHFNILEALIEEIQIKNGGDVSESDIFRRRPKIGIKVEKLAFDLIPSRGQMLRHNGNGIRHAKFAPSKSIAVVWEKIGETIYVTFDDHAPIRYHRAIRHLKELKLGRPPFLKRPRNTGRFLRSLERYWKRRYIKEMFRFNPKDRHYE